MYQCRCSLCRKVSGAASNSALWAFGPFQWLRGEDNISRWATPSGFQSCFCTTCGCPVPNPLRDGSGYWVPAGLLDDAEGLAVVAQVCVASRASWDELRINGTRLDDMVDRKTFRRLICGESESG
jgi:hypothetical protein